MLMPCCLSFVIVFNISIVPLLHWHEFVQLNYLKTSCSKQRWDHDMPKVLHLKLVQLGKLVLNDFNRLNSDHQHCDCKGMQTFSWYRVWTLFDLPGVTRMQQPLLQKLIYSSLLQFCNCNFSPTSWVACENFHDMNVQLIELLR